MKGAKLCEGSKNGRVDENVSTSTSNEKPVPLAVPIVDDERTRLKAAKCNRGALRSSKLLPAIGSLLRCKNLSRAMGKATFCLSATDGHECGADDGNCKARTLFGRWKKHEKKKEKLDF